MFENISLGTLFSIGGIIINFIGLFYLIYEARLLNKERNTYVQRSKEYLQSLTIYKTETAMLKQLIEAIKNDTKEQV